MEPAWVSAVGSCVGSGLIVVSLMMVRRQLQLARRAVRANAVQGVYSVWLSVDEFFAANSELRPYFYKGKEVDPGAAEADINRLEAAAEMVVDSLQHVYHQLEILEPEVAEAYGNYIKRQYQGQPFVKGFVDRHVSRYPASFIGFLRSEIAFVVNRYAGGAAA